MKLELPGQLKGPECRGVAKEAIAIRRALEPWFLGLKANPFAKLSIVLRVDGSLSSFGPAGIENVVLHDREIVCDLVIRDHDWDSLEASAIRRILSAQVLAAIETCLNSAEIEYDLQTLEGLLSE